ncbi:hypothetical protein EJ08DRAFT_649816 [Tothia fuscella]|uniref:Uncharacterized protein n=1 Tax=Tothia fuscella TaxID=1048955 RepID=A0A9P4TY61_9PEZI|nr:hypothetical protein EJ08DRAFT_649816 [Tothia fuscella]
MSHLQHPFLQEWKLEDPYVILCPQNERRTKTELLVQLIVVHFTTVCAFMHLLHTRKDSFIYGCLPLLYIITPYSIIIQHAIAVLSVLINYLLFVGVWHGFPSYTVAISNPLNCLLGANNTAAGYSTPEEQNENATPVTLSTILKRISRERIGPCLFWIVFLTQCSCSIYLYIRRKQHAEHAITIVDQRIFELAVGGVLVSFLILGVQVLGMGYFRPRVRRANTYLDYWVGFFGSRGDIAAKESSGRWECAVACKDLAISLIILMVTRKFRLVTPVKTWWANRDNSAGRLEGIFMIGALFFSGLTGGGSATIVISGCDHLLIYLLGLPILFFFAG